jgi:hypothetical protein
MKKIFFLLLLVTTYRVTSAQNVGIGTTSPSSRLHLVGNLLQESGTVTLNNPASIIQFQNIGVNKTFMQLSGDNLLIGTNGGNQFGKTIFRMAGADRVLIDSTGNTQILGLQDASLTSHGYLTLGSITGDNLIMDNNEIMARNNGNPDNLILQNDGGNVGIGVASPTAKLHVNGTFKVTDGTQAAGKVLTSDASGNASWQNSAYRNNDRIMVRFAGFGSDSLIDGTTTLYDNGGINFNIVNTRFTVTTAGLYHFEGLVTSRQAVSQGVPPQYYILSPRVFVSIDNNSLIELASTTSLFTHNEVSNVPLVADMKITLPFSLDIYLDAGNTVFFKLDDWGLINYSNSRPGYISGYLISE